MRPRVFRYLRGLALIAVSSLGPACAHGILLGVGTHITSVPTEQSSQLQLARKIGFDTVRDEALWNDVERTKGIYQVPRAWDQFVNDARRLGIEPLIILDYGNRFYDGGDKPRSPEAIAGFVRYATFVVKHFAGRVQRFEIWNEWDTHAGGFPSANAEDYARLFSAVFPAVKAADPSAVFLASASAGGRNEWYEQIARLGIAARADGVAVHPYVFPHTSIFGTSSVPDEAERSAQQVIDIENTMRGLGGGKTIPIYITEIGWPTSLDASGVTDAVAASLAQRMVLLFSSLPYVQGVWWYDLVDDGPDSTNSQDRFGLLQQNLAFKPAALAIQSIAPLIKNNNLTLNPASDLAAGTVALNRNSSSQRSVIAWRVGSAEQGQVNSGPKYANSCDSAQKILSLAITPMPTVFTYRRNGCTRASLMGIN